MRAPSAGIVVAAALAAATAAAEAPGVVVAEATVLDFPLEVEALGTARANESVDIRPELTEKITSVQFTEGQEIEAGAVLVTLEDSEAVAAVAAARAALVESENQLRRAQELFKTRALSASELDQRSARRDADRAILDAAESRLADTRVRAPFAGRVGLRRVSVGSLVTPQTVITTLDDTRTIKLDFDVPETALSRLAEGLPVDAHSAAWPELDFRGEIATVDTRVDPVTRTVTVRALIPNPEGRLRPGMFLSVIVFREDVTALMVPEQAIVPEASRQFVLVVGEDGVVERRAVRTGRRRAGQVEIVEGLAGGERVIAEGTQKAQPGQAVEVVGRIALRGAAAEATP